MSSEPDHTPESVPGRAIWTIAGWVATLVVALWCLGPVLRHWRTSLVGPFGGYDAVLQAGLLEWSARHWANVGLWRDLPIFHPLDGCIGLMDSLLGQAWLTLPLRWLPGATPITQYNLTMLASLLLAGVAMASLWRVAGGAMRASGVAALCLVGAPFTLSQLGHLNQLPPPMVLFALAATLVALQRFRHAQSTRTPLLLLSAAIVLQATWGWYGVGYAVIAVPVAALVWLVAEIREVRARDGVTVGRALKDRLPRLLRITAPPALIVGLLVWQFAQPQLELGDRYPEFSRTEREVEWGSADIQHLSNLGVHRRGPDSWKGQGHLGEAGAAGRHRYVLNPGWICLALAAYGLVRRRRLAPLQRRAGWALLAAGLAGLVLAFGESVGLPFTDKRMPLPLDGLREIVTPFRAYRAVWRFSWLMTVAAAWWAAAGFDALLHDCGRRRPLLFLPAALLVLLAFLSTPTGVPSVRPAIDGAAREPVLPHAGPVLTLPSPASEFEEDVDEAQWLLRALQTGRPVTGGASGWVPPEVRDLRERMHACEIGEVDPVAFLEEMKERGIRTAEIVTRPRDDRVGFWRRLMRDIGATRNEPWPDPHYEMYSLDPPDQPTPR